MHAGKRKTGRPRSGNGGIKHNGRGRKAQFSIPCDAIRLDRIDHFAIPIVDEPKQ